MGKIFINISKGYKFFDYYFKAYSDLYNKYNIESILFFDLRISKIRDEIKDLNGIRFLFYSSVQDLEKQILKINKKDIFYINTFEETLVLLVHDIRKKLNITVSDKYKAYRDKSLQRRYLLKNYPETTVKYFEIDILKEDINSYYKKLDFPYIIKPSSGVHSSGVNLINSKNDLKNYLSNIENLNINLIKKGINNSKFLIEEFIDGEMYTIIYFVDLNGKVFYSPIVKVNGAKKIGIEDFFNYVRITGKIVNDEIDTEKLKQFIDKQVKTFGIKNTFIFQDFKLNSKGEIKNIELNARIGGYRLDIMQNTFNFNLLEMIVGGKVENEINENNAVFLFYPEKNGILKGINNDLIDKIRQLKSIYKIIFYKKKIGQKVGGTKEGFGAVAIVKIKNNNIKQFKQDYNFIESNYKKLLVI